VQPDPSGQVTVNIDSLSRQRPGDVLDPDEPPAQPSAVEVAKLKPFRIEAAALSFLGPMVGTAGYEMRIPEGLTQRADRVDQAVHFEGRFEQTGFIKATLAVKLRPDEHRHLPWPPVNTESGFLEGARVERGLISGRPWIKVLKRRRSGDGQQWAFLYATFDGRRYIELRGTVDHSDRAWDAMEAAASTIRRVPGEDDGAVCP
jgi:hypothetical protein